MKLIQKGAEAELYKTEFIGIPSVLKKRVVKRYRDPALDKRLRIHRTRKEVRLLHKAKLTGARVPYVLSVHPKEGILYIEYIAGEKVKDLLQRQKNLNLCHSIGVEIAKLHKAGIIHGDLTTSNMILRSNEIVFIDFGLGKISYETEDRAVDLLNLKKTFTSTHIDIYPEGWDKIKEGYEHIMQDTNIFKKIEEVEKRGRYL